MDCITRKYLLRSMKSIRFAGNEKVKQMLLSERHIKPSTMPLERQISRYCRTGDALLEGRRLGVTHCMAQLKTIR